MNAPRSVLGKSNEQSNIIRRLFNLKLQWLEMSVKQLLVLNEVLNGCSRDFCRLKIVTRIRVHIAG